MSTGTDVTVTAVALLRQYGEDAQVIAVMRAAEVAAMGDAQALAYWDEVIDCITQLADLFGIEGPPEHNPAIGDGSETKYNLDS